MLTLAPNETLGWYTLFSWCCRRPMRRIVTVQPIGRCPKHPTVNRFCKEHGCECCGERRFAL